MLLPILNVVERKAHFFRSRNTNPVRRVQASKTSQETLTELSQEIFTDRLLSRTECMRDYELSKQGFGFSTDTSNGYLKPNSSDGQTRKRSNDP